MFNQTIVILTCADICWDGNVVEMNVFAAAVVSLTANSNLKETVYIPNNILWIIW